MALAALSSYQKAIAARSAELRAEVIADGPQALDPGLLPELRSVAESITANHPAQPSLIVSASGMATGGRVLHHLRHLLPDHRNTVLIVGFAAEGTRARDLANGARVIKIHGEYVPVHAEPSAAAALRDRIDRELGWTAVVPALGERVVIRPVRQVLA